MPVNHFVLVSIKIVKVFRVVMTYSSRYLHKNSTIFVFKISIGLSIANMNTNWKITKNCT